MALVICTSACSSGQESDAENAARAFYQAIDAGDGNAACKLLTTTTRQELEDSSGKPCPDAVLEEVQGQATDVEADVYGTMAQARSATDTAFLHRANGSWLVVAAGCLPTPTDTYDCHVKGN